MNLGKDVALATPVHEWPELFNVSFPLLSKFGGITKLKQLDVHTAEGHIMSFLPEGYGYMDTGVQHFFWNFAPIAEPHEWLSKCVAGGEPIAVLVVGTWKSLPAGFNQNGGAAVWQSQPK